MSDSLITRSVPSDAPLDDWRTVVDALPEAVVAIATDSTILYLNRAATALVGYEERDLAGRSLTAVIPERFRGRHLAGMARFVESGQGDLVGRPIRLPVLRADGVEVPVELVVGTAVVDGALCCIGLLRDVADRIELEGPGDLAEQVVRALAEGPTLDDALPRVIEAIVTSFGWDVGVLWEVSADDRVLRSRHSWTRDPVGTAAFVAAGPETFSRGVGLPGHTWASGSPLWLPFLTVFGGFQREAEAEEAGLTSALAIPVTAGVDVVGVIELFSRDTRAPDDHATERLSELARELAIFIERRRDEEARLALLEAERRARTEAEIAHANVVQLARTLQQSLLPHALPEIPGVELASRYHPAGAGIDVGGDFYDVFRTGRGRWGFVIGDVCGKGPDAARLTALARYTLRAAAMQTRSPARALAMLNAAMVTHHDEHGLEERFATVVYGVVSRTAAGVEVTFATGGHPLPMLVRSATGAVGPVGVEGTFLGIMPRVSLTDSTIVLEPGDQLVLVTDGVLEARAAPGGEQLGERAYAELLQVHAASTAESLAVDIEVAALEQQGGVAADDIAVLVVRAL